MPQIAHQLVLQVGCQRSGTTLLHLVLDSHKQIESFDEDRLSLLKQFLAALETPISQRPLVAFKLPQVSNPWDPQHSVLFQVPEGTKYVLITRHVFDAVASMCQLTWSVPASDTSSGGEFDWLSLAARRYAEYRLGAKQLPPQLAERVTFAATWWGEHNRYWLKRLPDLCAHHLRYEDLVRSPKTTIESLLTFLGCDWDEAVLNHAGVRHAPGAGTVLGKTDPQRPIDDKSMGRWQSLLGAADRERILQICGDVLEGLGYESVPGPDLPL